MFCCFLRLDCQSNLDLGSANKNKAYSIYSNPCFISKIDDYVSQYIQAIKAVLYHKSYEYFIFELSAAI